ncbi:unnamed protein product [Prorocentrum cordatum]|uniref:Uncharacterized protein n=1 Tax=Prorocentrum cordatum TaxID=2364126 RepID=A0ABN9TIM2_9DINO|nr:unnamed protein product [Polarella glacialis]
MPHAFNRQAALELVVSTAKGTVPRVLTAVCCRAAGGSHGRALRMQHVVSFPSVGVAGCSTGGVRERAGGLRCQCWSPSDGWSIGRRVRWVGSARRRRMGVTRWSCARGCAQALCCREESVPGWAVL